MATAILAACPVCGQPITGQGAKFCGHECYHEGQRRGLVKHGRPISAHRIHACAHCGERVTGGLSKKRNGETSDLKFCSRPCYHAFRSAKIERERRMDCAFCGKSFLGVRGKYRERFCSDPCRRSGRRPPSSVCLACKAPFTAIQIRDGHIFRQRRSVCSDVCRREWIRTNPVRKQRISAAFTGERHPLWQGGTHRSGFRGHDWERIAEAARKKAGYRCEHCGMTQDDHLARYRQRLNVNHREPFHQLANKSAANRPSNLEALCKPCHMKADWKWRKENPMQMSLTMSNKDGGAQKGYAVGERHPRAKLTATKVIAIRARLASGERGSALSKEFGVSTASLSALSRGITWKRLR